jgi:hypothetical protein
MRRKLVLLIFVMINSCARKTAVPAPAVVRAERYLYTRTEDGRLYIVTTNSRDFNEAMKAIHPGPASVDKLDLWVVTPAAPAKKEVR